MTTKSKFITGSISLLAAFLIGFVPQYLEKGRVDSELQATTERVVSLESGHRLGELRDLCGMMLLEVQRQNYGLTREYSTQYFEKMRQAAPDIKDPAVGQALQELLTRRDPVTALLAQSDPASSSEIQAICRRTYESTRR